MATTLNVIKTITIRGTAEGVTEVERQLESLAGAMEEVTVASAQQERATLSIERAYQKLQSRYDQEFRAQQNLAQVQKTLQAAQAQGLVTQERAGELMQQAIAFHNRGAQTQDKFTNSTKASRYELLNLSRQLQDVGVGLASGQALFTVAIQQGTQIADAFQTSSLAGRSLGAQILGLITPLRLLAVGTIAAAAAGVLLYNSWKSVEMQFLNLSERLNVPIAKLHELEAAAAIKGIDTAEFVKGMEAFGDQVNLAKRDLGDLGELFRLNGVRSKGLVDDFARLADLVKNARIEERVNILRAAGLPVTPEWLRFLSQGADAIKRAAEEATKFGTGADEEMIKKAREFDEAWNKAWKQFSLGWREIFREVMEGLGEWISKATELTGLLPAPGGTRGFATAADEQRLIELGQRRAREMGLLAPEAGPARITVGGRPTITPQDLQAMQRQVSLEQQRLGLLGNLATEQEKITAKVNEVNLARAQGVRLTAEEVKNIRTVAELQERASRLQRAVGALGEAATQAEQYAAAVADLNVKLADTTLSQEQFNRALISVKPGMQDVRQFTSQFSSGMTNALAEIATGSQNASEAFRNFGNQVLLSLTQMILKITLFNTLEKELALGLGKILPTPTATPPVTTAAVAHSGGVIGVDTFPRVAAHPALWNDAPHFQSGGLVGGVPIIAHTGEGIFTPGQMRAMGGQVVNVNVENNAPVAVTTEQTRGGNGEMNVKLIIDQVESRMADNMRRGRGPMSAATASRFGLNAARGNSVSG